MYVNPWQVSGSYKHRPFRVVCILTREELLDPMNLSVNGVARACGMHQPTLKRIVDGEITLSLDNARRLEQYFGFSDGYLSRMQLGFESIRVNCDEQLARELEHIVPLVLQPA